jgi:hypothetical protein
LGLNDTHKKLVPFRNAKRVFSNAHTFVNRPARKLVLQDKQRQMGIPEHNLIDSGKTRMLTTADSAVRLFEQLPCVSATVQAVRDTTTDSKVRARADGLLARLNANSFIINLAVEAFVLNPVNKFNRRLQARLLNFHSCRADLDRTLQEIEQIKEDDAVMKWLQFRLTISPFLRSRYNLSAKDLLMGKKRTTDFVDALRDSLKKRIPELDLVTSFDALDPDTLDTKRNNPDYGVADILKLFRHFIQKREPNKTEADVLHEWAQWKSYWDRFRAGRGKECTDVVGVMEVLLKEGEALAMFPILRDLSAVALTLTFSTAVLESAFSVLKVVKNYRSNALGDDTVDDILNILLNGPVEMSV